jgi:NAD-dependent SIR2 family protein deacetylase
MMDALQRARQALERAEALLIAAGAGMGVDSGLPDFRGTEGFWRAYPPFAKLGLSFEELANPRWFREDPALAWGFYGHRRNLYRRTAPHAGFGLLKRWADGMPAGAFVFTSNVDGHFQKAGFPGERVHEVHGAIDFLQCVAQCGAGILRAGPEEVSVDEASMRAARPWPSCPRCGALARPNILMFGDWGFDDGRSEVQAAAFRRWLAGIEGRRLVIVECGAGTAVSTVRHTCEMAARQYAGTLIRINVRESHVPQGHIGLAMGAREGLEALDPGRA